MTDDFWADAEIIHAYTRADAIRDEVLFDVTETGKEAGFKVPVALTAAVYYDCVRWTEDDNRRGTLQDESGRLWDVLCLAFLAARRSPGADRVPFAVLRVPVEGRGHKARRVDLVVTIGPGDEGEPVITIMQPNED